MARGKQRSCLSHRWSTQQAFHAALLFLVCFEKIAIYKISITIVVEECEKVQV